MQELAIHPLLGCEHSPMVLNNLNEIVFPMSTHIFFVIK